MYLVARVAKGFGAGSPLLLANKYGIIVQSFLDSLTPEEKLLIDHHLLNRTIEAENEAIERQKEEGERNRKMPGVTRMVSASERSEQLKEMRKHERQ
jgi:hypothetical protein